MKKLILIIYVLLSLSLLSNDNKNDFEIGVTFGVFTSSGFLLKYNLSDDISTKVSGFLITTGENYICYTQFIKTIEGIRKYEPKEYNGDGCATQYNYCVEDKCSKYDCGNLKCIAIESNFHGVRVKLTCDCGKDKYYNPFHIFKNKT